MADWNVYVHPDEQYVSIRRRDSERGDTLIKLPEGWRDHAEALRFFSDLAQALGPGSEGDA